MYLYQYYSASVRNLTGRQVENRFCTVLYRFLHLLQARPGGIFSLLKFICVGESHGGRDWMPRLLSLIRRAPSSLLCATQAARTCQNPLARANGSCWQEAASHWSRGSGTCCLAEAPANVANDIIDIFDLPWKPSNFMFSCFSYHFCW